MFILLDLPCYCQCFDEPSEEGTELNENNPLALAIVKSGKLLVFTEMSIDLSFEVMNRILITSFPIFKF